MESSPNQFVNDQTGEASPGVAGPAVESGTSEVPASPTPEPPETAETTQAAQEGSAEG